MSARTEITETAGILDWTTTVSQHRHDVLLRGARMVDVEYRADGSVNSAKRYNYFSIDNLHLTDELVDAKNKKARVLAWLAE